jgi:hypothetical protein
MFGARHAWRATAGLLAQLAFVAAARASDAPSTVVVYSSSSDPRLTRALVLIRGELSALGLDLQVHTADTAEAAPSAPEMTSERLSLDVRDGALVVRVFAAGTQAPLVESIDLDGPEVTAEVIAVRAVEALRAAHLLPPADQRAAAPKPPAEQPMAERHPSEAPPVEHPPAAPMTRPVPTVQLSLGPTFVQNAQGLPQFSARAALLVGPRWGFVALGAEGSLSRLQFERQAGSAQLSRRTLFLQLGARVRFRQGWEVNARGGLHYLHYVANGTAEPGYEARELEHGTGGASLSVGGAYYFIRAFGVYLDFSGLVAFDAARIRLADESVVTLDRPSFTLGTGVMLGAF